MLISIIIPTCKRNDLLLSCLNRIDYNIQNEAVDRFEVIVSDDSTDNYELEVVLDAKFPFVKYVKGPRKGPAANRNNGAKNAAGDWLLFIDDDCLPDHQLLIEYMKGLRLKENVRVFEGSINPERERKSYLEEAPLNQSGGYLWSCNFMIARQLFMNLGGFDEKFPFAAMEDVDLHYRLKKCNEEIVFLKYAAVIHPWRVQKKTFSVPYKRFKSLLFFIDKHPEKKRELNCLYFLRVFYVSLFKKTLPFIFKYNISQLPQKLIVDFTNLFFAAFLFIRPWFPKRLVVKEVSNAQ